MLFVAVVCSVLAAEPPPEAPAPPVAAEPAGATLDDDPAFGEGMRYYTNFEFEKAAFRFRAASRIPDLRPGDIARAELWMGLAMAQAGDELSAREAFVAAVKLDPSIALPDDAAPTIRPVFNDARAAAQSTTTSSTAALPGGPLAKAAPATKAKPALKVPTIVGAGLAGGGLLIAGAGAVVGLVALAEAGDAQRKNFQQDAIKAYGDAQSTANIGNGLLVVGGVVAAAGVVVTVVAPFLE